MSADDPRHNARVIALQRLFERSFTQSDLANPVSDQFTAEALLEINTLTEVDSSLADSIFNGVIENQERIDTIISELAPQWPLDQIAKTDLQILRIAILEGFIARLTPEKVAIDEAIELAREFANEQSRKFINGVLGNLIISKERFGI